MARDEVTDEFEVECIDLTTEAVDRSDNSGLNLMEVLESLLPEHPDAWYHAALELGKDGRANDTVACWDEFRRRGTAFIESEPSYRIEFSEKLLWGHECVKDLATRRRFSISFFAEESALSLVRAANIHHWTEDGLLTRQLNTKP